MIIKKLLESFNKKKKDNDLIPNSDVLVDFLVYQNSDANRFQDKMNEAINKNYEITNHIVDKDGIFKFTARLKHTKLTKCVLKKKKLPNKDKIWPSCTTYPSYCDYYINGVCTCANHDSCLYQKTPEHESILKEMVEIYELKEHINTVKYDNYRYNNDSSFYEDTEYGRIFSRQYEHLNELSKNYIRLHGN